MIGSTPMSSVQSCLQLEMATWWIVGYAPNKEIVSQIVLTYTRISRTYRLKGEDVIYTGS